jgi:cobaltochelatase CobT
VNETARIAEELFKKALAATTRAIAGRGFIDTRFGGDAASVTPEAIVLPSPPRPMTAKSVARVRGQADSVALKLAHHDAGAHAKGRPAGEEARAIFEASEQVRFEALGAKALTGVADNLDAALSHRFERRGLHRVDRREDAPLADAVAMLLRERLTGRTLPKAAQKVAELWRDTLESDAGGALDRLAAQVNDQAAFAEALRDLLRELDLGDEIGAEPDDESSDEDDQKPDADGGEGEEDHDPNDGESGEEPPPEDGESSESGDAELERGGSPDDAERALRDALSEREIDAPPHRRNMPFDDDPIDYAIYTTEFDEVVGAEDLCDPEELERLRGYLDQQLTAMQGVVARLANRLQRRLLAKQSRHWTFDLDEGVLDTARLTRVVTDPMSPLSFKEESEIEFRDTVVTLLLDNSGSMRGRPIVIAAMCADILARTLERCGVKVEILGFTTRAWKGGASRESWLKAGRPAEPGRLNDLRHIVYKPADTPYRRARRHLGLMMREGLLKENIDGEALEWAWRRLAARPEQRRILMVISDGAPVDDSTLSVNSGGYLDRHLRQVIDRIERRSEVELLAIGIGHDVTRWYRRAVTITDVEQLAGAIVGELAELFEEDQPGGRSDHAAARRARLPRASLDPRGLHRAAGSKG